MSRNRIESSFGHHSWIDLNQPKKETKKQKQTFITNQVWNKTISK